MRRFILFVVLIVVPALAVAPPFAGASSLHSVTRAPTPEQTARSKACAKAKKSKKAGKTTCAKPKGKGKPKGKAKAKATPASPTAPQIKPAATPTSTPKPTSTPTATPTSTPTPTATATPTATDTPLPPPSASLAVHAAIQQGYQAGFVVCGLPSGATASFTPNPVTAIGDRSSPTLASARSTLTVSVPRNAPTYYFPLHIFAYYRQPDGSPALPPPGNPVAPAGAVFSVDAAGTASLTATSDTPPIAYQGCSAVPAAFLPAPTPTSTVGPDTVTVSAVMLSSSARPGQTESVVGQIHSGTSPVAGVSMFTQWYFPNSVRACNAVTDTNGRAACSLPVEQSPPNYLVEVQVSFLLNGQYYTTFTSFTTQG